jgi:hypothetical protein
MIKPDDLKTYFHGDQFVTFRLKASDNRSNQSTLDAIRLDHNVYKEQTVASKLICEMDSEKIRLAHRKPRSQQHAIQPSNTSRPRPHL